MSTPDVAADVLRRNPALVLTLEVAVPLRISELASMPAEQRHAVCSRWAAEAVDEIASKGDVLQYGGKRGEAATVFNHLASALAALAVQPGGVTFAGMSWCVELPDERRTVVTVDPGGLL